MNRTVVINEFGGSENLNIIDHPINEPNVGEIRIAHKACGLNFIDVYQRTGLYPLKLPHALGMTITMPTRSCCNSADESGSTDVQSNAIVVCSGEPPPQIFLRRRIAAAFSCAAAQKNCTFNMRR